MKPFISLLVIVTIILSFSCDNKYKSDEKATDILSLNSNAPADKLMSDNKNEFEFYPDTVKNNGHQQAGNKERRKQPSETSQQSNSDWDKKIIKTATLNLEVKDYKAYYTSLREKVRTIGGYMAQEEQNQSVYKMENTVVIKVPVDQFDNGVVLVTENVMTLNEKKISSQDVSAEYVDTRSRMEAKKHVRLKYLDLLSQAKNMEEILSVQSEINGIQEEIESAAGRMEYLGHSSAFSTINLTFFQVLNSSAKDVNNPSFGTKLLTAFKTGAGWIKDLMVGLVSIWPLFLLGLAGVFFYKRMRSPKPRQA